MRVLFGETDEQQTHAPQLVGRTGLAGHDLLRPRQHLVESLGGEREQ